MAKRFKNKVPYPGRGTSTTSNVVLPRHDETVRPNANVARPAAADDDPGAEADPSSMPTPDRDVVPVTTNDGLPRTSLDTYRSRRTGSRKTVEVDERRATLLAQRVTAARTGREQAAVASLRPALVNLLLETAYVSPRQDARILGILYGLAIWCVVEYGSFDPDRDLAEERLAMYAARKLARLEPVSCQRHLGTLRRVRDGHKKWKYERKSATAPYTDVEMAALRAAARAAGPLRMDAEVLLALSGGAGLHPDEARRARADWVEVVDGAVIITVPNEDADMWRQVPVFGYDATVLIAASRERAGGYLFFHDRQVRSWNLMYHFKKRIQVQHAVFAGFTVGQARHYWLAQLLKRDLPFTVICEIAGIARGSHLATDIAAQLPTPTLKQSIRALRGAHTHDRKQRS